MRNRGDIRNRANFNTHSLGRPDRRFAAGAGALDNHIDFLQPHRLSGFKSLLGSQARGKWSALARTLEAGRARACPANSVALLIGHGNDGIVTGAWRTLRPRSSSSVSSL